MELRSFHDIETTRKRIYDAVKEGFEKKFPMQLRDHKLEIKNIEIPYDKEYDKATQKKAVLLEKDLTVPVHGTMVLKNKEDKIVDQRNIVLGNLPYLTPQKGTFIGNGSEYVAANQMRLQPGIYSRIKANDEIEAQFNTEGKMGFRVQMEPKTGVFYMNVANNNIKLMPLLKKFNFPEDYLRKMWGDKVFDINNKVNDKSAVDKLYKKLVGKWGNPNASEHEKVTQIAQEFKNLKLNPEITKITMGEHIKEVTPAAIVKSTKNIMDIFQGKRSPDDRDALPFKSFHGVEDFIKERIEKDSGSLAKKLMYKLEKNKSLQGIPSGYFTKWFKQIVRGDQRAFQFDAVHPLHNYDMQDKVIITGEGGLGNLNQVTDDARNVNPSQFGFIDPIRGPESENIGIDTRIAFDTYKGNDKRLYTRVFDAKTNKEVYLNPIEASKAVIAFPGEMEKKGNKANVMKNGNIVSVDKNEVDYYVKKQSQMLSSFSLLVPMMSAVSGNRTFMAGKAFADTLPFVQREAPIVRTEAKEETGEDDFETYLGKQALSTTSPIDGIVKEIARDYVVVQSGKDKRKISLYENYPIGHKVRIHEHPVVKVGDNVKKGQLIAASNFTDDKGVSAAGKHLLAAYWPYKGLTHEDGVVISESAANGKLKTEQFYKIEVPIDENVQIGRNTYVSSFPSMFTKDQLEKADKSGLLKPGSTVKKGDPLILAVANKSLSAQDIALGNFHKIMKGMHDDYSAVWDHTEPGEVVDAVITKKKAKIYVKTVTPAKVGDKLTGRYGNKGVISAVLPDDKMPVVQRTGEKLDMILNTLGVPSRTNPAQVFEGLLGKVGKETGNIYRMPISPMHGDRRYYDITKEELDKYKIPDQEEVIDPDGSKAKVMVTYPYFYRLSKMAEGVMGAREFGGYTANLQPAKGSDEKAIKIGAMELSALQGHGAINNIREMYTIKGQKNDAWWRNLKLGYPLPTPNVPFVYDKFVALLKASGANLDKHGDMINLKPLTDKEITKISSGPIREAEFLNAKTLEPMKGGFFDIGLTGGIGGKLWTHIPLAEPLPSPIMEEPIKIILGLNDKQFENIISGKDKLNGKIGGQAIKEALSKMDIAKEIEKTKDDILNSSGAIKNKNIKKYKYLLGFRESGVKPEETIIKNVPVIPPVFRPISVTPGTGTVTKADANQLYRDLFYSNKALEDLKQDLPDEEIAEERLQLYKTFKATIGTGPHVNPEFESKGVKPFIQYIIGDKPKTGFFFDKLISRSQDLVGRGVSVPDSSLSIDQIGLPEDMVWTMYKPFIVKELISMGLKAMDADKEIENKSAMAQEALRRAKSNRPVIINRAPTLHKFNMMAFEPVMMKHKAIANNPMIEKPFNLDHDGDALQVHVPVTEEARLEAINKMMPSKNVLSIKDYKPHYMPKDEDNLGLYFATTEDKKNKPIHVKSAEELDMLLKTKKITYDDRIIIDENSF